MATFKFESEEQRKGYLSLVQFWNKFSASAPFPITHRENLTALFFIQKDAESHRYWVELVGGQITTLQNEIAKLQAEIKKIKSDRG